MHEAQRIADELSPSREVGLDADRIDGLIELRVGIAAAVERASAVCAMAVHDRVEALPGIGRRRPAELEEARGRLRKPREERRGGPGLKRRTDSHLREHACDGLAHRRPVTGVDAVERHGEALGITGFLEQRPRGLGIVREPPVELRQRTVDEPGEIRACRSGLSPQHLGDDGIDVDRLIHGAPHAQILERVAALDIGELQLRAALVEPEVLRADVGHLGDFEALLLFETRDVLVWRVDHEVDLARDQRGEPGGIRLNHDVDRLVDVAAAAPPIRVRDQGRAHIGFVGLELVGAGSVGIAYGVGFLPGVVVLRFDDAVRRAPRPAHHGDIDQLLRQNRVGRSEQEIDGQIVDLARFDDATELEGALRVLVQRALDGERDIVRSEQRSVVKLHARAKLEAPTLRLELLPRHGKRGLQREVAIARHQRIVDLADHPGLV